MSGLEISLRIKDVAIATLWDSLRVSGMESMDCAAFAVDQILDAVAGQIVAVELRRLVAPCYGEREDVCAGDRDLLLARADELDPPAVNP